MATFKIAVMTAPETVELVDWEKPELMPDEIGVRVRACAICTSEMGVYRGERGGRYPAYMGHEIVATVDAIGPLVRNNVKVGDRVSVSRINRCGQCAACRKNQDNRCLNIRSQHRPGRPPGPGGFAEYMVVPGYQVFKLAADSDLASSALVEPVACCIGSIDKGNVTFGDTVVVVGGGVMGLLHTALLRQRGARVVVSEPEADRREKALAYGADHVVEPQDVAALVKDLTEGVGAEAVFVTSGPPQLVPEVFAYTAGGGRVVIYTSYYQPGGAQVPIDINALHYAEHHLIGTVSPSRNDFARAVNLVSHRHVDLSGLVAGTMPLASINDAFKKAIVPGTFRVIVTM
ncbi:MAG: alcohol dehydrogenase catalytic domain-containing protein [Bacillota bacterium]